MSALEARYRRLLRMYPADYRRHRGEEMVATYLAVAGPRRRWPSLADLADLVAGSVRQRVRAAGPGFAGGLHAAAVLALGTASGLAAVWLFSVELTDPGYGYPASEPPPFGPFRSLGAVVWLAWLTAAVSAAVSPRRARWATASALLITVAVVAAGALSPYDRPALMVLLPQVALGTVALGLDGRAGRVARWTPVSAAAASTTVGLGLGMPFSPLRDSYYVSSGYRFEAGHVMSAAGLLLGIASLTMAGVSSARGRSGGLWMVTFLVVPAALCFVEPVARRVRGDYPYPWNPAGYGDLVTATVGLTLGAAVITVTLGLLAGRSRT